MPTRGLAAVLNQGLATLGEKLGKTFYLRSLAFYRFEQVKLGYGVLVLGSNSFSILPWLPQKIDACFKSGENR